MPVYYSGPTAGAPNSAALVSQDPEAGTIESAEFLTHTARGVQDVCDMFDEAAG